MTSRIKLIPAVFVALIILPVSFAKAVESEPNFLEELRSLKTAKIAQLIQDCNYTQYELEKCMRARIVPVRNISSKDSTDSTREKYQKPKPLTYPSREAKRAAIDDLQRKLEILQQNLARVKANDLNIIIEDVFREPFAVGQIGRIDFDKEHPRQRMRINTIIDGNNCLVDFKIATLPSRKPTMARIIDTQNIDTDVLAKYAAHPREATIEEDYKNPLSVIKTIWLRGFKTSGRVDGSEIENPPILVITGTRAYDTIMGAKSTVYVFEPLEIPANAL